MDAPIPQSKDRNQEQVERLKQIYQLCWEAEEQGMTTYRAIADYIHEKTGVKVSHTRIQKYKIDRQAQEEAAGILIAKNKLVAKYLNQPNLLHPEITKVIQNTKIEVITYNLVKAIFTWTLSTGIVLGGVYLIYQNQNQCNSTIINSN